MNKKIFFSFLKNNVGFTLLELTLAITVLVVGVISALSLLPKGMAAAHGTEQNMILSIAGRLTMKRLTQESMGHDLRRTHSFASEVHNSTGQCWPVVVDPQNVQDDGFYVFVEQESGRYHSLNADPYTWSLVHTVDAQKWMNRFELHVSSPEQEVQQDYLTETLVRHDVNWTLNHEH